MSDSMHDTDVGPRRYSRVEYERLVERGEIAPDERLELIGGVLVARDRQRDTHAFGAEMTAAALQKAFGIGYRVRVQLPVALDEESEPEPDVSVVRGSLAQADRTLPSRPELIVEVAESSLTFDRREKASLYARARVEDYWIVNLVSRVLEVHREPVVDDRAPYGWRYASTRTLTAVDVVFPLSAPLSRIAISDLLP
ncbi:MAG TPA: Uma2 family endonuclease [Candidatus Nitrosotalea sp.]|jgi:Uma2 family endonuclease|nr:Uma2 family endonuclease [Candidatus Nitrosotalea sp.]